MSYDITIIDKDGNTIYVDQPHTIAGNTFCAFEVIDGEAVPGTRELWINITSNLSKFFYKVLGKSTRVYSDAPVDGALVELVPETGGLFSLQSCTISEAITKLKEAVNNLSDEHLDIEGNQYDMITPYDPDVAKKISILKYKASPTEDDLRHLDFLERFMRRPLGAWAPTEANAREALKLLLELVELAPKDAKIRVSC